MHRPTVGSAFLGVKHLPPLSHTASRLLEAVADPDIEIDELAGIIAQDPPLSARLLGIANSAYFGQTRPVNSVREAIIRVLGLNLVKSLAVSIALAGTFDPGNCPGFDLADYWYSALATASLSRLLAMHYSAEHRPDVDSFYLCGMLHNLGYLLLAHVFPRQLSQVITEWTRNQGGDIRELERQYLDTDRLQAGEWLARRWHLPEAVADVIGRFDDAGYQGPHALHRDIVSSASQWVSFGCKTEGLDMADDRNLNSLPGIGDANLSHIGQLFQAQCEELYAAARVLVA